MPELPEVETIINGLRPKILNKEIQNIQVLLPKIVWLDSVPATGNRDINQVKSLLEGKSLTSITRRGKMIILHASEEIVILLHLKMTGQLIYVGPGNERYVGGHPSSDLAKEQPVKSTRIIITFIDNSTLYFNDQRQFGYLKVLTLAQFRAHLQSLRFGPEALDPAFNGNYLYRVAQSRFSITIKQLILDQRVVAGVGNIYADESLFQAKIHPAMPANKLTLSKMKLLVHEIKKVLKFSIAHNGTSSEHYVTSTGEQGDMQNYLKVYRKHGEACPRCGAEIDRMVIGGRGTHFCLNCQRLPKIVRR